MNFKGLIGVIACTLGALTLSGKVEASAVSCLGCVTTQDFQERASVLRPGVHYLYNLHDNVMQTWRVPTGYIPNSVNPNGVNKQSGPSQQANPAGAVRELDAAHKVYITGRNSIRPIHNVHHSLLNVADSNGKTVYDVVWDYNLRTQIASAVADPDLMMSLTGGDFWSFIADVANIGSSYLNLRNQMGLTVRVIMADGGYLDFKVNIDDSVGLPEDAGRTASGQAVPAHQGQVQGDWVQKPGDDLNAMAAHFKRLGVSFDQPVTRTVLAMSCTPEKCYITLVRI